MDLREEWRKRILEDDLDDLEDSDGPGGIEAADAEELRELVGRIRRAERRMDAALSEMAKSVAREVPVDAPSPPAPSRRSIAWRRWAAGSVAAAAVLTALLLRFGTQPPGGGDRPGDPDAAERPSMVEEMAVEADRSFVVFPTENPNIAVVWLLDLEESEP